jgi:hypothetical protein
MEKFKEFFSKNKKEVEVPDLEKVKNRVEEYKEIPIIKEILLKIEKELPEGLKYHNVNHAKDVMESAVFLGLADGLSDRELELLAIASACHDGGFLERRDKNEEIGAKMAKEAMEKSGNYTKEEIQTIVESIEDTEVQMTDNGLNQIEKGRNTLSDYLLDADVSHFAKEDFTERTKLVAKEFGVDLDDKEAYKNYLNDTLKFLNNHKWKSNAAKSLFEKTKEDNIEKIRKGTEE